MKIEDFIKQFIEGYLFCDLESMANITVEPGNSFGGAGYPMVSTTLAGMELLGGLLMPNTDPFDPNKGNDYFLNYWENYFCTLYPEYTKLGRIFRQLMRNGISHTFVAKPGIFVEKGSNRQMSIDTIKQEIYIDCNVFYKEFEDSYKKLVKPILSGASMTAPTKASMQARLDDLSNKYTMDSSKFFKAIPTLHGSTINTGKRASVGISPLFTNATARASGASIPLGPSGPISVPTSGTVVSSTSSATASMPTGHTGPKGTK